MAGYTILDIKTISEMTNHYELGSLKRFESLAGGRANSSVTLFTDTGKYILTVCDEKSIKEIQTLVKLLDYLKRHDFPTTRVIQTKTGQPLIEYKGKAVYMKRFIEGKVCQPLSTNMAYQLGEALAQLHIIPPHPDLPHNYSYGMDSFSETLPANSEFIQWLKEKRQFLNDSMKTDLPKGFIHGDLFFDNSLYSNDNLVAVLDFEEACYYYFIFDLGMCAVGACTHSGKFSMELIRSLVEGYQTIKGLGDNEKNQLQVFIEFAAIATAFWRFRQYNIRNPDPDQADHYLEMTSLADQIHEISKEAFAIAVF